MNGVATKKTPSAMIRMPLIRLSVRRWSDSVLPSLVALMPRSTNMIVKLRQKMKLGMRSLERLRSPERISARLIPETALR
jgi:hypothetical protein